MQKSLQLKVAAEKSEQEVVMDYYSSQINKLIQELSELPGIGSEVCTASGVSYPEYAGGAGRRTLRGNYQCQEECPVLQGMFYTDRR